MKILSVVLAAGKGTRLGGKFKLIREVNGIPIIERIVKVLKDAKLEILLILGHKKEDILDLVKEEYILQNEQKGTAHALMQAEKLFKNYDHIIVLPGDAPLIEKENLSSLIDRHLETKADATILTAYSDDPKGYGRIIRLSNRFRKISEEKDCNDELKKIKEINSGIYCFKSSVLEKNLNKIKQNLEYLLTDIFQIIVDNGSLVETVNTSFLSCRGINTLPELIEASNILKERKAINLINRGVEIIDPKNTYIDERSIIESGSIIYPNVIIKNSHISSNSCIKGNTSIKNSFIGSDVEIESSNITDSIIGRRVKIGPFAHIRNNSLIGEDCRVGNFVEITRSNIGKGVKIAHMSYIGDTEIENGVNIGAGVITCNYDGKNKYRTLIKEKAFIGSNSNLVAPVKVGKKAFIAAGATVIKDVEDNVLYISKREVLVKKRYDK